LFHFIVAATKIQGFDKAYVLFGQYLLLKKDKDVFVNWLKEIAGMSCSMGSLLCLDVNSHHSESAFNCLNECAEQYI